MYIYIARERERERERARARATERVVEPDEVLVCVHTHARLRMCTHCSMEGRGGGREGRGEGREAGRVGGLVGREMRRAKKKKWITLREDGKFPCLRIERRLSETVLHKKKKYKAAT
jgi:hypothetical protein